MNLENTHWYIDGRDRYLWHMNILNFKMASKSMILSNFACFVTKQLLTEHILYDFPINGKYIKFGAWFRFDTLI